MSNMRIIIQGITEEGKTFRPSDWPQRLCGRLSTIRNRRIIYSPLLRPIYKDGTKCVAVDCDLEQMNPDLYSSILRFARNNHLVMTEYQTTSTNTQTENAA